MRIALIYFLLAAVLFGLGSWVAFGGMVGVTALTFSFGGFLLVMGLFVARSYAGVTELLQAQNAVAHGDSAKANATLDGAPLQSAGAKAWAHWLRGLAALYGDDDAQAHLHFQHVVTLCKSAKTSFYVYRDRLLASAAAGEALAEARLFQLHQDPARLELCQRSIAYAAPLCAPFPLLEAQVLAASAMASTESARPAALQALGPHIRFLDSPTRAWVRALYRPLSAQATYRTAGAAAQPSDTTPEPQEASASAPSSRLDRAGSYDAKATRQPVTQLVLFVILISILTFAGVSQLKNLDDLARNIPLGMASGLLASLIMFVRLQRSHIRNAELPNLAPRAILGDTKALQAVESETKHVNTAVAVNACAHTAAVYASLARYDDVLRWVDLGLGRIKATPSLEAMFNLQLYPTLLGLRAEALACLGRADEARAEVTRLEKEFSAHPSVQGTAEVIPLLLAAHAGEDSALEPLLAKAKPTQHYALDVLMEGWTIALSTSAEPQRAALFLADLANDPITQRWLEVASPAIRSRLHAIATDLGLQEEAGSK